MAMGAAKSTGRPAVLCVVPGPGVLNAAAALCTAMGGCAPVICLTGQVPSEYLGRGRGHLHELADQSATLQTIIKDAWRIDEPAAASAAINRAFRTARSGRPGPVAVEMCWDTMAQTTSAPVGPGDPAVDVPDIDPDCIARAADLLASAKKPMIMCGAGAQHAREDVLALAELLDAPVTAFRSGRGVVAEDHPLAAPPVAARELWDDVDALIGVGSRLEMPYMRWRSMMHYEPKPDGPKLVRIDIDAREMQRLIPDVGIVADAKAACRLLVDRLAPRARRRRGRRDEIAAANAVARRLLESMQPQQSYLRVIRDVLPRDGFLVPELSQVGFATYTGAYPVLEPRTYVSEGYQGTLGFGFPTALGVKVANPGRAVVSVCGDGGFMFAVQELATAAQYEIGVIALVFNNNGFANVRRDQREQFEGHVIGCDFDALDFVDIAEALGVAGFRVHSSAELGPVLAKAIDDDAPAVIEVITGEESSPWPYIHMPARLSHRTKSRQGS